MASVGDIFYSSWGYDQTNINWYQVVSTTDKTVTLRELNDSRSYDDFYMSGETTPIKNSFKVGEKPIRRKLNPSSYGEYIKISSYEFANPWDGTPKRYSSYA